MTEPNEYDVVWAIDLDDDSPKAAAEQAWGMITDAVCSAPNGATALVVRATADPSIARVYEIQGDGSALLIATRGET